MTRWCKRCGRKQPITNFRVDVTKPKRFAAERCFRCEVKALTNHRGNQRHRMVTA